MSTVNEMSALARKVAKLDPAFAVAVKTLAPCPFGVDKPSSTNYQSLIRAIIAQQVSSKAAKTIGKRLTDLCDGRITPEGVGALSLQQIQSAGLTGAKVRTISEFTAAILNGKVQIKRFTYMSDDEILSQLLPLFGFGKWTIEMFLIFQLGRIDIWPVDDLAVRRGWDILHANTEPIKPKALMVEGERFAGLRSVAAWYCWRAF